MLISTQSSFDKRYVRCKIPKSHQVKLDNYVSKEMGIAVRRVWSALTTDNTFTRSVWAHTIYDSKCMSCNDTRNCTLKVNL